MTDSRPPRRSVRVRLVLAAAAGAAALGAAQSVTDAWMQNAHTLDRNGAWTLGKRALEPTPDGARAMGSTPNALRYDKLNLGAWSGYQHVVRSEAVDLASFSAGFELHGDECLHMVWGGTDQGSAGVRLSTHERLPTMAWTADADGIFTAREVLVAGLEPGWSTATVAVEADGAFTITIDDATVGAGLGPAGAGRVGFRGCLDDAWVDDVRVRSRDGRVWAEDWAARGRSAVFAVVLALLSLGGALVGALASRVPRVGTAASWLGAALVLIAVGVAATLWSAADERTWGHPLAQGVPDRPARLEPSEVTDALAGRVQPVEAGPRILFVGTDQTAGHGARAPGHGFVEQTCPLLPRPPTGAWQCLSGGYAGSSADELFKLTRDQWMKHRPALLVLVLGAAEIDLLRFERALVRFADLGRAHGVPVVLATEPTSSEAGLAYNAERHAVTRRVAASHGLVLIDLQGRLFERRDDGLLWWDLHTLSAAGHRIAAEEVARGLTPLLGPAAPGDQPSAQKP